MRSAHQANGLQERAAGKRAALALHSMATNKDRQLPGANHTAHDKGKQTDNDTAGMNCRVCDRLCRSRLRSLLTASAGVTDRRYEK